MVADHCNDVAAVMMDLDMIDEAKEMYEKQLHAQVCVLGGQHPDVANACMDIAQALEDHGDNDGANSMREPSSNM